MSQVKNDEPPTDNKRKNELFSFSSNNPELIQTNTNTEYGQKKNFVQMAFMESHASCFHIIHSIVKSWRKTVKYDNTLLKSQKPDQICHSRPQGGVVNKDLDSARETQKNKKDTRKHVCSKHLTVPRNKSKRQQKDYLGMLPPTEMLPYLTLIKRCISLPISVIQSQCLKGKILCRIQYFTLRHRKEEVLSQPAQATLPSTKSQEPIQVKYVTFDSLKDLQWKLYKGLLKRKPKTVGTWREPSFSLGIPTVPFPYNVEYILPLIPKDWLIDVSLGCSESMSVQLKPNI